MIDIASWTLDEFNAAIHQGGVGLWSWDPTAERATLDSLACAMWGGLDGEHHSLSTLFARVHPDDREAMEAAWWASASASGPYEFNFRVTQPSGTDRWISARGQGGSVGSRGDEMMAIFVDVTRIQATAEMQDRLVREMAHRVSNLFTIAGSMSRMAARGADDAASLADDLNRRFAGLAAAYKFAVTQSGAMASAPLGLLAEKVLEPFGQDGTVNVSLPANEVSGEQVTNMALVLHELCTNAVKYGALSEPGGIITLSGAEEGGVIRMVWRERGGPTLTKVPHGTGFGSKLMDHTVTGVFGGAIERRVEDGSLVVALTLDAGKLAA